MYVFFSFLGSGFGTIISPPIVNYIITKHSWQGVVLFYASLCLLATILGLFLVQPPREEEENNSTKSQGQELVTLIEDKELRVVKLGKEENLTTNDEKASEAYCAIFSNEQSSLSCQNRTSLRLLSEGDGIIEEKDNRIQNENHVKESNVKMESIEKSTFSVSNNKALMKESACEKLWGHVKKAVNTTYVIHPLLIMFCCVNLLGGLRCC